MSRRPKPAATTGAGSQRLPARHDIPTSRAHQRAKSRSRDLHVTSSTASSRAKQHTSLRMAGPLTSSTKDLTKSVSMIHHNTTKTKTESKKPQVVRKVPTEAEAFYANLLLLGFSPDEVSAKHRGSAVTFDKDMFNVPNMLAFQVVMHFLFNKLDAVKFHEDFRDCWPICDRKQEQAFRKACLAWLTEIGEKEEAHLPRLVPSLLLSPGGNRFYQLVLSLSTYILQKLLDQRQQNLKIQYPLITPKNVHMTEILARTMKEAVARRRASFFSNVQQSIVVNKECEQFANDLVKEYRSLNDEIRAKERILKELRADLTPSKTPLSPRGLDSISAAREDRLAVVRTKWQRLQSYYDRTRKERDVVSSIISGTIDRHRILGSDYNVHVPDLLLRTKNEEIQKLKLGNTYEFGKLNLVTVVKLWTLSMGICVEKTVLNKPPNLAQFAPNLIRHVHDISAYLANLRSLKNKIGTLDIPSITKSINDFRFGFETPQKMWNNSKETLGFVPPTPPVSFEPLSPYVSVLPHIRGKTPPQIGSTPEAAAKIMQSVQKRSRRQKEEIVHTTNSSRLPKPQEIRNEIFQDSFAPEAGPVSRFRQHSGPTGRISTPTRPRTTHYSGGRKPESQSKPIQSIQASNQAPKMPMLKPSLNARVLDHLQTVNDNHTKPCIKTRAVVSKPESTKPANNDVTTSSLTSNMTSQNLTAKTTSQNLTSKMTSQNAKKSVSKELFTFSPPMSSKERAEDELIDQLVNAITSPELELDKMSLSTMSSPENLSAMDVNVADPLPALDDAPFQKRDKIANSPPMGTAIGSSPALKGRKTVQFSPGTRVELEKPQRTVTPETPQRQNEVTELRIKTPNLDDVKRKTRYDVVKSPDVVRHFSPSERQSPVARVFLSPLPEFASPIQIEDTSTSNFSSENLPHNSSLHEPSPARLQSSLRVMATLKPSPYRSPMTNVPVLDLAAVSPTGDVMDASLELVDMSSSSSSDESEKPDPNELVVPTGNLLGFVPRDPSPSCITPCKNDAARLLANNDEDSRPVIGESSPGGAGENVSTTNQNSAEFGFNDRGDSSRSRIEENHPVPTIHEDVMVDSLIDLEPRVLNSEHKIEMIHEAERKFEEEMMNLSLKVTGTPEYGKSPKNRLNSSLKKNTSYGANSSILGVDDENDVIGMPRTPMDFHVKNNDVTNKAETPMRIPFSISPNFQFNESPSPENLAGGDSQHVTSSMTSPGLVTSPKLLMTSAESNGLSLSSQRTLTASESQRETDIVSRFRSLKLRAQNLPRSKSPVVLTPEETIPNLGPMIADEGLDSVYLQQSPRRESNDAAKFVLDLDLDDFVLDDINGDLNNNSRTEDDDSEVCFRSPEKVVEQLATKSTPAKSMVTKVNFSPGQFTGQGFENLSGLLDMDGLVDDLLVPDSPTGGDDLLL